MSHELRSEAIKKITKMISFLTDYKVNKQHMWFLNLAKSKGLIYLDYLLLELSLYGATSQHIHF